MYSSTSLSEYELRFYLTVVIGTDIFPKNAEYSVFSSLDANEIRILLN